MRGKVGKGRHGSAIERNMVCALLRSAKRAKRSSDAGDEVLGALKGATLKKNNKCFNVIAKPGRTGGVHITLEQRATR